MSLRNRIIFNIFVLMAVIGSMTVIFIRECQRMQKIELRTSETHKIRQKINKIYYHITKLTILGENLIDWEETDYRNYQIERLHTDSLLQTMKSYCINYVQPQHIDSLCKLLKTKEMHLYQIMRIAQSVEKADSLISNELPLIVKRAVRMKTVTRKKKGLAGLFGKKDTIQFPYYTNEIHDFNKKITSVREWRNNQMEIYVDSLRLQNNLLKRNLSDFVYYIDRQTENMLIEYNQEIMRTRQDSFRLFTSVMIVTVSLIIISFFIVRSHLCKEEKIKFQLRQAIQENEDLLEMRKKIILTVSHDIRGPLGNIHNCADLATETRQKKKRGNCIY